MKIVYVHRTQGQSVEGVHIRGMCQGFAQLGHETEVLGPVSSGARPGAPQKAGVLTRIARLVSAHAPELLFELMEIAYDALSARKIGLVLDRRPVDLVYERYAFFGGAASRAAHRRSIPLVLEMNYTTTSPLVRRRSALLMPLAKLYERRVLDRAAVIAVVSSTLRDDLIHRYGVPKEKIVLTPNAADPAAFAPDAGVSLPSSVRVPTDALVVGFVGSFAPWHGVDLLVRAFSRLAARHGHAYLLLVGDGPTRSQVERDVAALGLADRVGFTGQLPANQLPGVVARFDVAVMPDSNDYGSPMKIFEYMAMAKPVVAPEYRPILDVLQEGESALLFEPQSLDGLSSALQRLADDRNLAGTLGRRGRELIESRHNWRSNAVTILDALSARRLHG